MPSPSSFAKEPKPTPISFGRTVSELGYHFDGVIRWDALAQRLVFRKPPPFRDVSDLDAFVGQAVREQDMDLVRLWFELDMGLPVIKQHVIDAVRLVGRRNSFHPVKDYLDALSWDGVPRIATWLESFAHVRPMNEAEQALIRAVGQSWLVSCVARAMTPGCKSDSLLILEGEQGIGKSTALRALAGDAYFSDALIDFATKDACQVIQGVWIHELAELDAILRGGTSQSKAFLTRTHDRFRAPYTRAPESIPRSVSFCGTVNHGNYLKDKTGNRRYWAVRCEGPLDVDGLRTSRDALWAEARVMFERGVPWHLSPEHERHMADRNTERLEIDPLDELVAAWTEVRGETSFGMNDILEGLGYRAQSWNPLLTRRIAPILEGLGFERRRTGPRSKRVYRYARRWGVGKREEEVG